MKLMQQAKRFRVMMTMVLENDHEDDDDNGDCDDYGWPANGFVNLFWKRNYIVNTIE